MSDSCRSSEGIAVRPGEIEQFYLEVQRELCAALAADPVLGKLKRTAAERRSAAKTMADPRHQESKITMIERELGASLRGKQLLEVGSGIGDFIVTCRRRGIPGIGVEPFDPGCGDLKAISRRFLEFFGMGEGVIVEARGEALPFPPARFDVVFSYYVFEHVQDPARVLAEAIRVLKPGGLLLFVFPNYGSLWEGHYGVPWLPRAGRALARLWLRAWGRDPAYIDTLRRIDLPMLRGLLRGMEESAQVVSLGKETFIREVGGLRFTKAGTLDRVHAFLRAFEWTGALPWLAKAAAALGMFTPFYLVLRKKALPATSRWTGPS
jgi:SAM-dependent methyltransferase